MGDSCTQTPMQTYLWVLACRWGKLLIQQVDQAQAASLWSRCPSRKKKEQHRHHSQGTTPRISIPIFQQVIMKNSLTVARLCTCTYLQATNEGWMKLYRFLHDHVESIPDGLLCLLCFSVGQHRVHLNKHCLVEDREEHPSQCTVVLDVLRYIEMHYCSIPGKYPLWMLEHDSICTWAHMGACPA